MILIDSLKKRITCRITIVRMKLSGNPIIKQINGGTKRRNSFDRFIRKWRLSVRHGQSILDIMIGLCCPEFYRNGQGFNSAGQCILVRRLRRIAASGADVSSGVVLSGGAVPLLTGFCLVRSTRVSVTILILLGNRTQRGCECIVSADCACFRNLSEIPSEIQRFRCPVAHRSVNLHGQQFFQCVTGQRIVLTDAGHFHHPDAIGFLEGILLIHPFPGGYAIGTAHCGILA